MSLRCSVLLDSFKRKWKGIFLSADLRWSVWLSSLVTRLSSTPNFLLSLCLQRTSITSCPSLSVPRSKSRKPMEEVGQLRQRKAFPTNANTRLSGESLTRVTESLCGSHRGWSQSPPWALGASACEKPGISFTQDRIFQTAWPLHTDNQKT